MAGEGEFDFIARRLAPLTSDHPGAYGLKDDGAILAPPDGCAFAVTSDTLVEGVHFPTGEDPFRAGWKALAANVSDLTAMGATPGPYLLNIVWPKAGFAGRVDRFVDGLIKGALRQGWRLSRLDATVRAILRSGGYELLARQDVPTKTVINEYIDIAHAFFEGSEPGFVNGTLDTLAKQVRQGAA